jgi:hypothetical protein
MRAAQWPRRDDTVQEARHGERPKTTAKTGPFSAIAGGRAAGHWGESLAARKFPAVAAASPIPVQIVFRGLAHSDTIERDIRARVEWLGQYHGAILGCRATVELPTATGTPAGNCTCASS